MGRPRTYSQCRRCDQRFSSLQIDGRWYSHNSRVYCWRCSPLGSGNTGHLPKQLGDKRCSKCREEKPLTEFYMAGRGNRGVNGQQLYHSWCKECHRQETQSKNLEKKRALVALMGGQCQQCGYNRCLSALTFHHRNPNEKELELAQLSRSLKQLRKEALKCVLLCFNCHQETHEGLHPEWMGTHS